MFKSYKGTQGVLIYLLMLDANIVSILAVFICNYKGWKPALLKNESPDPCVIT